MELETNKIVPLPEPHHESASDDGGQVCSEEVGSRSSKSRLRIHPVLFFFALALISFLGVRAYDTLHSMYREQAIAEALNRVDQANQSLVVFDSVLQESYQLRANLIEKRRRLGGEGFLTQSDISRLNEITNYPSCLRDRHNQLRDSEGRCIDLIVSNAESIENVLTRLEEFIASLDAEHIKRLRAAASANEEVAELAGKEAEYYTLEERIVGALLLPSTMIFKGREEDSTKADAP